MPADSRPGTVVVPLDFSKASQVALSFAVAISRALKSKLLLLQGFRYVPQHEYAVPVEWMTRELLRRTKHQLNLLRHRISRAVASAETMLLESAGDPATEILRAAETQANPILVLGTHSRIGLDRFFIGSTAEEVLRNSKHPAKAFTSHSRPRTGFQIIMSAPCAVLTVCE